MEGPMHSTHPVGTSVPERRQSSSSAQVVDALGKRPSLVQVADSLVPWLPSGADFGSPTHTVVPGTQSARHMAPSPDCEHLPTGHAWLAPHLPSEPQVCRLVPSHRVAPGAQSPPQSLLRRPPDPVTVTQVLPHDW
jgi:hypothetical protein